MIGIYTCCNIPYIKYHVGFFNENEGLAILICFVIMLYIAVLFVWVLPCI